MKVIALSLFVLLPRAALAQCDPVANLSAIRIPTGVFVNWTADACAERVYLEASRGTADQVIESVALEPPFVLAVPRLNTDWRIAARAFNADGLSSQRSVVLLERTSDCLSGLPAPTLLAVQVIAGVLFVNWTPDPHCVMTHYTIAGSATPDGPWVGSIDVQGPASRAWSGIVPPGTYFVRVYTRYYDLRSAPSASVQVTIP
jgi:hypothetical protein